MALEPRPPQVPWAAVWSLDSGEGRAAPGASVPALPSLISHDPRPSLLPSLWDFFPKLGGWGEGRGRHTPQSHDSAPEAPPRGGGTKNKGWVEARACLGESGCPLHAMCMGAVGLSSGEEPAARVRFPELGRLAPHH